MGMIVDRDFCASSFLALRFIGKSNVVFGEGLNHHLPKVVDAKDKRICNTCDEIDRALTEIMNEIVTEKTAIFLSGGIDSGILASYMPKGSKAYTVHNESPLNDLEVMRASKICETCGLEHVIVEVDWDDYGAVMDDIGIFEGYPVFGNTPQLFYLTRKAMEDGHDQIIFGDDADMVFGGLDKLLSKEWKFDEWVDRVMFLDPKRVLKNPVDLSGIFEPYRVGEDDVDSDRYLHEMMTISTGIAYYNIFEYCKVGAVDPYNMLRMSEPLNLARIRSGESKYLLRELYHRKYPKLPIPEKIPMARPMDIWMKDWEGPKRDEFLPDCLEGLTGEQKFLCYSLERFLNRLDSM